MASENRAAICVVSIMLLVGDEATMSSVDATDRMLTDSRIYRTEARRNAREHLLWLGGDAPLEVGIRSRISPDLMQQLLW